jgi:hypothetical protein
VLEHGLQHHGGAEDDVGAARLDARQRAAGGRALRELGHQLGERGALEHRALDRAAAALGGGREVADGAAHADEPAALEPWCGGELLAHRGARRLELLARDGAPAREELLGHPYRAERPRGRRLRLPARHLRELEAAAAEVEHDAIGQRRRVDGGDVAQPRLLLGRQHRDREAGALLREREQVGAVVGVADRAGRHRVDSLVGHAAGVKVAPEHLERHQPARHRVGLERAGAAEALRDPDRLLQLPDAAPGRAGEVGVDDEPPGVRAEVDHCGHPLARRLPAGQHGQARVGDAVRDLRHRTRC